MEFVCSHRIEKAYTLDWRDNPVAKVTKRSVNLKYKAEVPITM